jgi:hypothetical protein
MLNTRFVPQVTAAGSHARSQRITQDGNTPNTANTASDFLQDTFAPHLPTGILLT